MSFPGEDAMSSSSRFLGLALQISNASFHCSTIGFMFRRGSGQSE